MITAHIPHYTKRHYNLTKQTSKGCRSGREFLKEFYSSHVAFVAFYDDKAMPECAKLAVN